jgi:hypothetical protein
MLLHLLVTCVLLLLRVCCVLALFKSSDDAIRALESALSAGVTWAITDNINLSIEEYGFIANALLSPAGKRLQVLDLRSCDMGDFGLHKLSHGLWAAESLTHLILVSDRTV